MKLGIVILNYNTYFYTIKMIENCYKMNIFDEIVVIDNCSFKECIYSLKEYSKQYNAKNITYIFNQKNVGYASGNNIGLKYLVKKACDICFISNPDVHFDKKVIEAILNVFIQKEGYGILTTSRIMENPCEKIRQYWALPDKLELILENFILYNKLIKDKTSIYKFSEAEEQQDVIDIDVAPGAFFAIKSDCLKKINYLDEKTFLYFEENCLAKKLKAMNIKIGIIPGVHYTCLDRKQNATSVIRKTTFSRKCYSDSKIFFASKYLKMNAVELLILKITCKWFIFEKWVSIRLLK